jgi:hypothetical protein
VTSSCCRSPLAAVDVLQWSSASSVRSHPAAAEVRRTARWMDAHFYLLARSQDPQPLHTVNNLLPAPPNHLTSILDPHWAVSCVLCAIRSDSFRCSLSHCVPEPGSACFTPQKQLTQLTWTWNAEGLNETDVR